MCTESHKLICIHLWQFRATLLIVQESLLSYCLLIKRGLLFPLLLALLYLFSPKPQKLVKETISGGGVNKLGGWGTLLSQVRWCVYVGSCMSGTWGCSLWCAWESRNWRAGCRKCWQTGHRSHLHTLRPRWGCRGCWSDSWSEGYLIR